MSKNITDEFLFGDHVQPDVKILKQLQLRDKRNGPKIKKKDDHKVKLEPEHDQLFGLKKEKKIEANMQKYKSYGWDIHVDMF